MASPENPQCILPVRTVQTGVTTTVNDGCKSENVLLMIHGVAALLTSRSSVTSCPPLRLAPSSSYCLCS